MNIITKNILIIFMFNLFGCFNSETNLNIPSSIYDFKIKSAKGEVIDFNDFKGKKILIVNVASKCGFTPQYADLEKLYKKYNNNLMIVGFPANDFLWQEPASNKEIAQFCEINYKVTFPIAEKISVKGSKKHPIYEWLTNKKYNKFANSSVKWNFQKYLIDENGKLVAMFGASTNPLAAEILMAIQNDTKSKTVLK